ncbi:hypothetical protein F5Y06DRAFT_293818 [Hypoxylon sp. FL0890]|nr:hypothetical protein F5Y06DRAFT_293818 [Hypoxylon sp. FL0890]
MKLVINIFMVTVGVVYAMPQGVTPIVCKPNTYTCSPSGHNYACGNDHLWHQMPDCNPPDYCMQRDDGSIYCGH